MAERSKQMATSSQREQMKRSGLLTERTPSGEIPDLVIAAIKQVLTGKV